MIFFPHFCDFFFRDFYFWEFRDFSWRWIFRLLLICHIFKFLSASSIALLALTLFFPLFHFSLLKNLFFYTSYLIIRDLTWSFMILLDHSWSYLIILDHSWSCTTMYLNNLNSLSCQKSPIFPKISHFSKREILQNTKTVKVCPF